MTMSVVDGIMGSNLQNKEPSAIVEPSVHEIANAFARQYYQVLCEDPKSAHKFYGHESTLLMNEHPPVSGQEKIGRMLEDLIVTEKSNRIKVHNLKSLMVEKNKSIMVLAFAEIAGRRFNQTFLLASQGLKKYYIQHDVFIFCDLVFPSHEGELKSVISNENNAPETESLPRYAEKATVPLSAAQVNGHRRSEQPKVEGGSSAVDTPEKPRTFTEHPNHDERPVKRLTPRKEDHTLRKKDEPLKSETVVESPKAPVPSGPKTWANLVGGGSNAKTSVVVPQSSVIARQQPKQIPHKSSPVKPQVNTEPSSKSNQDRTLFVGGIQRNASPQSAAAVEAELKEIFSAFAEVENVSIPPKSLGKSGETTGMAYAFVTMKSVADLKKVIDSATKGDNSYRLSIKVPSFGHDGEVNISEQKNHDRERYNNNRGRGGFRGGSGGNFRVNRGARGGGSSRGNNHATI